jgi:hypothetical protein
MQNQRKRNRVNDHESSYAEDIEELDYRNRNRVKSPNGGWPRKKHRTTEGGEKNSVYQCDCRLDTQFGTATAARKGHYSCMKYIYETTHQWDTNTTAMAAQYGNMDCLRYAYENGCPWNSMVTSHAVGLGRMDMLVYAYENDCPWDIETTSIAVGQDRVAYSYLKAKGAEQGTAMATASALACLTYAHEHKAPWHPTTTEHAALLSVRLSEVRSREWVPLGHRNHRSRG